MGSGEAAGAKAKDFALIGFKDFELQTVIIHALASGGDVAGNMIEKPSERGGAAARLRVGELDTEELVEFVHGDAAAKDEASGSFTDDIGSRLAILFADFTDNFLD